jgi:hypothetical protein
MLTEFLSENMKEQDHLECKDVDYKIIFIMSFGPKLGPMAMSNENCKIEVR